MPAEFRDKMSSAEADYFIAYSDIIAKFVSETGVDIMSVRRANAQERTRWRRARATAPASTLPLRSQCLHLCALLLLLLSARQDLQAPKENTIEVIALRDCGQIMTTKGQRDVREKEVHVLRKVDAEQLIRIGWLRHITDKS